VHFKFIMTAFLAVIFLLSQIRNNFGVIKSV